MEVSHRSSRLTYLQPRIDQHIRVYFQRDDGFIYQSIWNERGGWEPTVQKLYEAKLGTSITANYLGLADGIIRIFFSSPNDDISLASYLLPKDKWTDPSTILSASVGKILSITSLAATGWFVEGRGTFRLFYQRQDFTIQELVQATGDDPWVLGTRFKVPAYPGSSITASSVASLSNSDGSHRVYYQATDTSIYELAWGTDGVIWTEVHHNVTIPPRSGLGSTIWRSADNIHAKLYFLNNSGVIQEWQFDGVGTSLLSPSPMPLPATASHL